jgi:hypothetical protein
MTRTSFDESALRTADTFHDEFPDEQAAPLSWLAEAASVERIPDYSRDRWFARVSFYIASKRLSEVDRA